MRNVTYYSRRTVQLLARIWKPALAGLLLLLIYLAINNLILLSSALLHADASLDGLWPHPIYAPFRIRDTALTERAGAANRIGSDLTQVYFPAQDIDHLQNAFDGEKTLDPWKRPSRYAPLVILACAATFCKLNFGVACLLEMLFQTLLFYGVLYWAFWQLELRRVFLPVILLVSLYLFLTPVGLSWFERGQFSLYLASGYAVLLLGLLRRNPGWMAAAAVLAFIKWTAYPAILVILVVYLLGSRSFDELKANAVAVAVFALVSAALLGIPALFTSGTPMFIKGLINQEFQDLPGGISLLLYVPRLAVKLIPAGAIILGYISLRTSNGALAWLVPFAAGVVIVMLIYPTRAYDYSLPSVLGFVPVLIAWARQPESGPRRVRTLVAGAFVLFVVAASFSTHLLPSRLALVEMYVAFSVLLMLGPALFIFFARSKREPALSIENNS